MSHLGYACLVGTKIKALTLLLIVFALPGEALSKECRTGVPCGNSCIAAWKTCNINIRAQGVHQKIPRINWSSVSSSSWIEEIGFRSDVSEICVRMINRTAPVYCYPGDQETFDKFLNASSKGQFYNSVIKPRGASSKFYE